ncbi:hypothetical protein HY485_04450 [Candidatus Woesearchaeota archaeon]|nr:hypothetical protein [Candidatus Woesearchaeota archaeon]
MKIFYGIAGEGLGHATRSRPLIQYLLKRHSVRIFAGGKAFVYIQRWLNVNRIESMRLKYSENKMSVFKTVVYNVLKSPWYFFSFLKVFSFMLRNRPDVVITDFEPGSAWSAIILRVPLISIQLPGHYLPPQPFLRNKQSPARIGLQEHNWWARLTLWFVTTITVPYADAVVIPSFFQIPLSDIRVKYVEPIIREEIVKHKSVVGGNVLVYQTSGTYHELLRVLKQFPQQQFVVYGFAKSGIEQNIVFKPFNEDEFFDDLCSAKAVITNGGISLMTEAVFLGKPVLSIPIRGHGEQLVNAFFLGKTGNGCAADNVSELVVGSFLKSINARKNGGKKSWHVEKTFASIEEIINLLGSA